MKIFDTCCDRHNQCLNAKCCTQECQNFKNECDKDFEACLKQVCLQFSLENSKFYPCLAQGAYMASSSITKTCHPNITKKRKLCYCHINI